LRKTDCYTSGQKKDETKPNFICRKHSKVLQILLTVGECREIVALVPQPTKRNTKRTLYKLTGSHKLYFAFKKLKCCSAPLLRCWFALFNIAEKAAGNN